MATFCHYIYAGDSKWWAVNNDKINISAERWTCSDKAANTYKLHYHIAAGPYNSGMRAIQFGVSKGFKSIALLGYDCSIKNGVHWHGLHTEPVLRNPTVSKIEKWHDQFKRVADTDLTCFEKMTLEEALKI
jgi:hypothetical protein